MSSWECAAAHLEVEVAGSILVGLTDEGIEEGLQVGHGCSRRTVALVAYITGFLNKSLHSKDALLEENITH